MDADGLLCFLRWQLREGKPSNDVTRRLLPTNPGKEFPPGGRCMELKKVFINQGRNNASVIGT